MSKKYFGCRLHFKSAQGTDKVYYHNTAEESDAFFARMVKKFKASTSKVVADGMGRYEDRFVVISKENIEFPE